MAIEPSQIHNLVRTYQRAIHQEAPGQKPAAASSQHDDHVTVSAEARERHSHKTASTATPHHPKKPRKP